MRVSSIDADLVGTTSYSIGSPQITYDIAYDMWLSNSGTRTPCQHNGTVEVMVWTDYDQQALLPQSLVVGTANIPFAVDGVANSGQRAWTVYASNVYPDGRTAPWGGTVWLVLDQRDATEQGTVSVDLSKALSAAGTVLEKVYRWGNFEKSYWLDTVPFGVEFGPAGGQTYGAGPAVFSLDVSSYCLDVGASVSQARC